MDQSVASQNQGHDREIGHRPKHKSHGPRRRLFEAGNKTHGVGLCPLLLGGIYLVWFNRFLFQVLYLVWINMFLFQVKGIEEGFETIQIIQFPPNRLTNIKRSSSSYTQLILIKTSIASVAWYQFTEWNPRFSAATWQSL